MTTNPCGVFTLKSVPSSSVLPLFESRFTIVGNSSIMDLESLLRAVAMSQDVVGSQEGLIKAFTTYLDVHGLNESFLDFAGDYSSQLLGTVPVTPAPTQTVPKTPAAPQAVSAPQASTVPPTVSKVPKAKAKKAKSPTAVMAVTPANKAAALTQESAKSPVKAAKAALVTAVEAMPCDPDVRQSRSRSLRGDERRVDRRDRSLSPMSSLLLTPQDITESLKDSANILTVPTDPEPMEEEFRVVCSRKQKRARARSEARTSPDKSPRARSPVAKKAASRVSADCVPLAPPASVATAAQIGETSSSQAPGGPAFDKNSERTDFVILSDKREWPTVSKLLAQRGIPLVSSENHDEGIKITVKGSEAYRAVCRVFTELSLYFRRRPIGNERDYRVVIRGIPKEFTESEVKQSLEAQGVPVRSVHRLHNKRRGKYDIVLVKIDPESESRKTIFAVKEVCMLSGLRIEQPHKRMWVGQCHNCQFYGHSQKGCFARPRCVKCLGDHATRACTKSKDTPPSCVLCRQTGHTANFGGCPMAPKKRRIVRPETTNKTKGPVAIVNNSRNFPAISTAPQKGRYLPPSAVVAPSPASSMPKSQVAHSYATISGKRAARAALAPLPAAIHSKEAPHVMRARVLYERIAAIENELLTADGPNTLRLFEERSQLLSSYRVQN